MQKFSLPFGASPLVRRVAWHLRRVGGSLDRRFFLNLAEGIVGFVVRGFWRKRRRKPGRAMPRNCSTAMSISPRYKE